MTHSISRRGVLRTGLAAGLGTTLLAGGATRALAAPITLRLSSPATPTDQRALGLIQGFGPAVKDFATFEPHWNATLFKQGTELEAIARGNLDMSITSAQELATLIPAWSIFTSGYLMRDAEHQKKVFASDVGAEMYKMAEDKLGVKLLTVMYLGRRQLNLRTDKEVRVPADLAGVKLRMPGTDAWLFLGRALGANPVPVDFTEIYTALQTGATMITDYYRDVEVDLRLFVERADTVTAMKNLDRGLSELRMGMGDQASQILQKAYVTDNPNPAARDQLDSTNGHYIRSMDDGALAAEVVAWLARGSRILTAQAEARLLAAMPQLKERAKTLVELIAGAEFLFSDGPRSLDEAATKLLAPEARAGRLLRRAGVPKFKQNFRIDLPDGRWRYVDFFWPRLRAVLEIDSVEFHSDAPDADATDDRHIELTTLGLSVVHDGRS